MASGFILPDLTVAWVLSPYIDIIGGYWKTVTEIHKYYFCSHSQTSCNEKCLTLRTLLLGLIIKDRVYFFFLQELPTLLCLLTRVRVDLVDTVLGFSVSSCKSTSNSLDKLFFIDSSSDFVDRFPFLPLVVLRTGVGEAKTSSFSKSLQQNQVMVTLHK